MKAEIICKKNDREQPQWFVSTTAGEIVNISESLNEGIIECWWQDNKRNFIVAFYGAWDSTELYAILDANGKTIKKGISEIIDFIEDTGLFIVRFEGRWLEDEQLYYSLADDDWKMAVIDRYGAYLIEPEYEVIVYDDEENVFVANRKYKFDLLGNPIK